MQILWIESSGLFFLHVPPGSLMLLQVLIDSHLQDNDNDALWPLGCRLFLVLHYVCGKLCCAIYIIVMLRYVVLCCAVLCCDDRQAVQYCVVLFWAEMRRWLLPRLFCAALCCVYCLEINTHL